MKKILLFILFFYSYSIYAQPYYYWYKDEKIYLEKYDAKRYIIFDTYEDSASLNGVLNLSNMEIIRFEKNHNISSNLNEYRSKGAKEINWAIIESDDFSSINRKNIVYDAPFFLTSNNVEVGLSNLFFVKLNKSDDILILDKLSKENNVEILGNNKFMPLWYTLSCTNNSAGDALAMANLFYETQLFSASEPDLMADDLYLCANDIYFSNQWGLNNTGQNNGTSGIDINFCNAKLITSGNPNIIVAVLDQGVELNHPDLTNMCSISYDTETSSSPSQVRGNHGTACAGIIGANSNNSFGISGIAPNCKIMSISNYLLGYPSSQQNRADGINFAVNNGASIISNSWGSSVQYQLIDDAIANAVTNGRSGKGCIVTFSSGNDNGPVNYPANSNDKIIVVGAISQCGERKSPTSCDGVTNWGSCYGQQLDIMAPGILIPTTDRQGANGYNTNSGTAGDYVLNFSGTSSAAPHVSGVAALMLSANPNLTAEEVKEIIGETAKKLDGYTFGYDGIHENGSWNQYVGYGLIDAHKAVFEAFFRHHEICGPTSLEACDEYTYNFGNKSVPNWASLYWITSDNIEIVSGEHSPSVTVRPVGEGSGWIRAQFIHNGYYVIFDKQVNVISTLTNSICYRDYYADEAVTMPTDCIISDSFTIGNGGVVTISSTAYCSPNAKIIIQPGGKLVVDGGTLTNLCPDKMWDAIYVVGNYYQRQLAQYQGTIEVKNNSVIENSKWGIVTWNGTDYATSGGIVKCSSSTFRNNGKAIEFFPYTNHNSSGAETDNVNYAQKCTFVVDGNNLFASNNITFSEFVKISHVRGVSFKGSSFRDGRATADSNTKGIYSDGAGFTASELCLYYNSNAPCDCVETATRTKFSRLGYGIYAVNDGTTYNFTADHAIFDTCYRAVQIDAVNSIKVTRSDFDQTSQGVFSGSSATGVYLNNSTGYTIEANSFATNYSTCPSGFMGRGVYVYNSGTSANTIYRNTMSKLYHGIRSNSSNGGLQLLCNEFSGNFYADINVLGAISSSQGSSSKSAGNKFASGVKKIYSPLTSITYYHSGANGSSNDYCPYYSNSTVSLIPNITANNCAPTICIPITPPPGPKSAPENDDITLYESLQQMYNARLTEYNAAGYGFLLENFDENDADIVAIARLKQDTLISLSRTMAEIANRNLNAILADSVLDRESLNSWYNRINTQTAKYSLANSYFEIGEYALARQELAAIPQHFALSTDELAEYDNFCDYNALRESVFTSGRNYAQLTEEEIAELEAIADLNTGVSSAYANSVLCFFYGICREIEESEIDDTPVTNKNAVATIEENETESLAVYVYPNPADEELNILLNSMPEGTTTIEFHDVTGRLVLSEEIKSANTSINISSLRQGVYMYRIVNGDNVIARDRIVKK